MVMVCPRCCAPQEQRLYCPLCRVRLQNDRPVGMGRRDSWLQRPWGRVVLGLMLAQGLYHGLQQLVLGAWLATHPEGVEGLDPWVFFAVQGLGLLVGAAVAGAGQRTGAALGAVVGFSHGLLCLLISSLGLPLPTLTLVGLPLAQFLMGGLCGWLGRVVWQPLPLPTLPGLSRLVQPPTPRQPLRLFAGPIAWFRVALGSAVAVGGWLQAVRLFHALLEWHGTRLPPLDQDQDLLITWEVKVLAVLLGSALSGVNTLNGFKQGFCVAILTTGILLALPAYHVSLLLATLTTISIFPLCVSGGWFGAQLLPPVVKFRSRRLGPMHG